MKTKESMGDSPQLIEVSETNSDAVVPATSSIADNKRRRLVRGAMAVAPLVLTLRSGAVAAAASCTGAKQLVNLPPTGQFPAGGGANLGDTCVTNYEFNGCPAGKISSGTNTGVQVTLGFKDGDYACNLTGITGNVALLSTAAVNSLVQL